MASCFDEHRELEQYEVLAATGSGRASQLSRALRYSLHVFWMTSFVTSLP